jgi:hypothetical protein
LRKIDADLELAKAELAKRQLDADIRMVEAVQNAQAGGQRIEFSGNTAFTVSAWEHLRADDAIKKHHEAQLEVEKLRTQRLNQSAALISLRALRPIVKACEADQLTYLGSPAPANQATASPQSQAENSGNQATPPSPQAAAGPSGNQATPNPQVAGEVSGSFSVDCVFDPLVTSTVIGTFVFKFAAPQDGKPASDVTGNIDPGTGPVPLTGSWSNSAGTVEAGATMLGNPWLMKGTVASGANGALTASGDVTGGWATAKCTGKFSGPSAG